METFSYKDGMYNHLELLRAIAIDHSHVRYRHERGHTIWGTNLQTTNMPCVWKPLTIAML